MKAKLVVVGGTTSTDEVLLRLPAIIGRGRSAQVTIPHALVSRQHCEISEADGQLLVRDLDSLNGTYVGDERIKEAILMPGALLTVGTVTFRAIYEIGDGGSDFESDSSQNALDEFDLSDELHSGQSTVHAPGKTELDRTPARERPPNTSSPNPTKGPAPNSSDASPGDPALDAFLQNMD